MTAQSMFPTLALALSDGREFKVQPVMIDTIRVERVMGSFTDRQMEVTTRTAWHAAMRSQPNIPDDFDQFAEMVVSIEQVEGESAGNPTTDTAGTG